MNTVLVVDDAAAVQHLTNYLPYGKKVQVGGLPDVPFDFNTKRREATIGLIDFGARHYDPEVRQWMAPDPLRLVGVTDVLERDNLLQPFAYAAAAPTVFADDGHEPCGPLTRGQGITAQDAQVARAVAGGLIALAYRLIPGANSLHGVMYGKTYLEWEAGRPGSGRLNSAALLGAEVATTAVVGAWANAARSAAAQASGADAATKGLAAGGGARALSKEAQRGIRSLEKQIAAHEKKLADFKANPTVRPGMEGQPKEVIEAAQQSRIRHLEKELRRGE